MFWYNMGRGTFVLYGGEGAMSLANQLPQHQRRTDLRLYFGYGADPRVDEGWRTMIERLERDDDLV